MFALSKRDLIPVHNPQLEREPRASSNLAFGVDSPAHRLSQFTHEGQAQSSAAGGSGSGRIGAVERFENVLEFFGFNADAGVLDGQVHVLADHAGLEPHQATLERVTQGIVDQVADHLAQAFAVGQNVWQALWRVIEQPDVMLRREWPERIRHAEQQITQIDRLEV